MKHGNTEITEWAQHEDESHDARYGAESEKLTPYDFNTTASRRFGEQDGKVWTHADNWKVKPNGEDNLWLYDKIIKWCDYWEGKGYDFVVKSVNGKIVGVIPSNQILNSFKANLRQYRVGNDFVRERPYVKINIEDEELNIHSDSGHSKDITFIFVPLTRGLSVYGAEYDIQDMGITTIVADNEDEVWNKFTGDKVYSHDSMWEIVDVRDAETSGQWEIGEQLEEAQMNAEGKKRSGLLSDPFDELSLDSGGIKKGIIGLGIVGLTILGIKKLRK
ncbi:MAG: hypothetical protein JRI92_07140 [Deltaproteobacteria bacterium]|nr:hypothetical protein [Deltaproteobacteria bacterium]